MIIAILGGTGKEGSGLAVRWARVGHKILIGSRDAERARQRAAELSRQVNGAIEGLSNLEAARRGELVVITVPFAGHRTLLEEVRPALQGKIVVDTVGPVDLKAPHPYVPPAEGSAAEEAQSVLGPRVKVVAALHHIAAHELSALGHVISGDGLFCGDDAAAKAVVAALISAIGARPVDVGPLKHAPLIEGITPLLIEINKRYRVKASGIHITGI